MIFPRAFESGPMPEGSISAEGMQETVDSFNKSRSTSFHSYRCNSTGSPNLCGGGHACSHATLEWC